MIPKVIKLRSCIVPHLANARLASFTGLTVTGSPCCSSKADGIDDVEHWVYLLLPNWRGVASR